MNNSSDNQLDKYIWTEAFRPKTVEECIIPDRIKLFFKKMVDNNNIQSYTASGPAGCGKTSSARALCNQLGIECLVLNMSNDGGIDTVRTKIVNFATSLSFTSDYKVVILDEFDGSSAAAQSSLKGIIEQTAKNCRFIITANNKNKIIDPILSRCVSIDFNFTPKERMQMTIDFIKRVKSILEQQNVLYDEIQLSKFCKSEFPDFRQTLNKLQYLTQNGELKFDSIGSNSTKRIDDLIKILKNTDFTACKKWVVDNIQNNDHHLVRRSIYDRLVEYIEPSSIPDMVLLINQYDYREAFVADKEINFVAFLTETMVTVTFK